MDIKKQILLPTLVLALIAAIVAGLLSFTYVVTGIADIDTGLTAEDLLEYQAQVFPDGGTMTSVDVAIVDETDSADLIAVFNDGQTGVAIHVSCVGYAGQSSPIEALIGINYDGEITGVTVISSSETPGLGTKIEDVDYLAGYVGLTDASTVDTITAATYSSSGLRDGVSFALDVFEQIKEEVQ